MPTEASTRGFNFGANWQSFSDQHLDESRVAVAVDSLRQLLGREDLTGVKMLDVGCGTGLFSIAAVRLGASFVVGIDVNPMCVSLSRANAERFGCAHVAQFDVVSALDRDGLNSLGVFDVVYAWGSLHHTGAMWRAIENVAGTVSTGGTLVAAIYARHVTSPLWRAIKRTYNQVPAVVQRMMTASLGGMILVAKFAVTGRNPLRKERGMDFWTDVVDWVGGYPYEYATPAEVDAYVTKLGFFLRHRIPASVPTGCNEFVFERTAASAATEATR